jgi:hypothetical protein
MKEDALTTKEYLAACDLGVEHKSRTYIRARLDASAERADQKCGNSGIAKGKKCRKGGMMGAPGSRKRSTVKGALIGAALGAVTGNGALQGAALGGLIGNLAGRKVGVDPRGQKAQAPKAKKAAGTKGKKATADKRYRSLSAQKAVGAAELAAGMQERRRNRPKAGLDGVNPRTFVLGRY